jgi:hypothetical protein
MSKKITSRELKKLLSNEFGGYLSEWRRQEKTENLFGEVRRDFENIFTGDQVSILEHQDGMLTFEGADGDEKVARLSTRGRFNARAKYSAVDNVTNDIINGHETSPWLLKRAIREGLAKNFDFTIFDASAEGGETIVYIQLGKHFLKHGAASDAETTAIQAMLEDVYTVPAEDESGTVFPNMTAADVAVCLKEKGMNWSKYDRAGLPEVRKALSKLNR